MEEAKYQEQKIILYIEDNETNFRLVERALQNIRHYQLISSTTAEQGLVLAMSHQPDLILMDIDLPGMSGTEALVKLQEHPTTSEIPVIALSAHAMLDQIEEGLRAGFKRYLTKPMDIPLLVQVIHEEL